MRAVTLLAMLCTSATAAPVPKELKKQGSIVGVWKIESFSTGGVANEVGDTETEWTIDENFALTHNSIRTQLKIDTVTKEIDWCMGISILCGRYEVRGDRLTICLSKKNLARQTTLVPNPSNFVWVLRRAEK